MRDGWTEGVLGDCFTLVKDKADPAALDQSWRYVGLEHMVSDQPRVQEAGQVASVTSQVSLFKPGDVLFGRLRPYLRKIAGADFEGACSPEILILRSTSRVAPGFLYLLASSEAAIEHAIALSAGSRMPRTSAADLASLPISLPPLAEQRRIVDLIGALDKQVMALKAEWQRGQDLLGCLLDAVWDSRLEGATTTVGNLADLTSGPSWAAMDERPAPEEGALPVLKITNTRADGSLDLSERLYVRGLPDSTRVLDDHSLIVIRTNGNRARIGNVYLPSAEVLGSAVSAFQFILQARTRELRDFLYWTVRAPQCQRLMSDAASGSTGLGNLGARWLRSLEIPWLDDNERAAFVANANTTGSVLGAIAAEIEALRLVRTILLTSLLNGEVEIPESYDALLAEAVG